MRFATPTQIPCKRELQIRAGLSQSNWVCKIRIVQSSSESFRSYSNSFAKYNCELQVPDGILSINKHLNKQSIYSTLMMSYCSLCGAFNFLLLLKRINLPSIIVTTCVSAFKATELAHPKHIYCCCVLTRTIFSICRFSLGTQRFSGDFECNFAPNEHLFVVNSLCFRHTNYNNRIIVSISVEWTIVNAFEDEINSRYVHNVSTSTPGSNALHNFYQWSFIAVCFKHQIFFLMICIRLSACSTPQHIDS